jgi:hypothetical protein
MTTEPSKRKMLAVTMLPDLYQAAKDAAARRDMAVTTWVREVVVEKLAQLAEEDRLRS